MNRRPKLTIVAPSASAEEAAAVVAALERFMRETAPPLVAPAPRPNPWQRAALVRGRRTAPGAPPGERGALVVITSSKLSPLPLGRLDSAGPLCERPVGWRVGQPDGPPGSVLGGKQCGVVHPRSCCCGTQPRGRQTIGLRRVDVSTRSSSRSPLRRWSPASLSPQSRCRPARRRRLRARRLPRRLPPPSRRRSLRLPICGSARMRSAVSLRLPRPPCDTAARTVIAVRAWIGRECRGAGAAASRRRTVAPAGRRSLARS